MKKKRRFIDALSYLEKQRPRGLDEETWQESNLYKSIMSEPYIEINFEFEEKKEDDS